MFFKRVCIDVSVQAQFSTEAQLKFYARSDLKRFDRNNKDYLLPPYTPLRLDTILWQGLKE